MKLKNTLSKYTSISDEILGGTPVFLNTRVPVQILFDYLKGGENLQEFLDNYPTVKKATAKIILELSASYILENNETAA